MRSFHAIEPDHLFIFHIRNDVPRRKGEIGNDVTLHGSRAATVAIAIKGDQMTYGIARCQWCLHFNRKLAREVAIGRTKQAFTLLPAEMDWLKQGRAPFWVSEPDPKLVFGAARGYAIRLVKRISLRAVENGYLRPTENMLDGEADTA